MDSRWLDGRRSIERGYYAFVDVDRTCPDFDELDLNEYNDLNEEFIQYTKTRLTTEAMALYFMDSLTTNTGLDEILQIDKSMNASGGNVRVSRILMKFDLAYISQSMHRGTIARDAKFYLNMYDANPSDLSYSQSLYAYPVSQSWVSGEGKFHDNPVTGEGASWYYKDGSTAATMWDTAITSSGGTWYTASYATQSFAWGTTDMRMDVTPIVNKWLDGTYPNEGFMLKRSGSVGNLGLRSLACTGVGSGLSFGFGWGWGQALDAR